MLLWNKKRTLKKKKEERNSSVKWAIGNNVKKKNSTRFLTPRISGWVTPNNMVKFSTPASVGILVVTYDYVYPQIQFFACIFANISVGGKGKDSREGFKIKLSVNNKFPYLSQLQSYRLAKIENKYSIESKLHTPKLEEDCQVWAPPRPGVRLQRTQIFKLFYTPEGTYAYLYDVNQNGVHFFP